MIEEIYIIKNQCFNLYKHDLVECGINHVILSGCKAAQADDLCLNRYLNKFEY